MVNEYMFNEIMQMPSNKNGSLVLALEKMSIYCKDIKLLTNEKHEVFYQVDASIIKCLDLESSDLLSLNQSGWVLSKNGKFLEFFI